MEQEAMGGGSGNIRVFTGAQASVLERLPCLLLIDTSGSMKKNNTLTTLQNAVRTQYKQGIQDNDPNEIVYTAVMTFDTETSFVHDDDFACIADFDLAPLTAQGETCLGKAMRTALETLNRYRKNISEQMPGITFWRPYIVLFTDAVDFFGEDPEELSEAIQIIQQARKEKKVDVIAIGIGPNVNLNLIRPFSEPGKTHHIQDVTKGDLANLVAAVSVAITSQDFGHAFIPDPQPPTEEYSA